MDPSLRALVFWFSFVEIAARQWYRDERDSEEWIDLGGEG